MSENVDLIGLPPPPRLPPPAGALGPGAWLRHNLFSSWLSGIVTVVLGAALLFLGVLAGQWLAGARWGVVTDNLRLFLFGQYPPAEAWRIWLTLALLSFVAGWSAGGRDTPSRTLATWLAAGQALLGVLVLFSSLGPFAAAALLANVAVVWIAWLAAQLRRPARRLVGASWLVFIPVAAYILSGAAAGPLVQVPTGQWGGLLLTFVLALAGIGLSFPVGIILALARRSDMPVLRILATTCIEVVRGVPLITILFMASIMLPLFLPGNVRIDSVLRAIGGITIFSAAYVAENVRGGLQAIPTGQIEAANSIGLNVIQRNLYIVLPQALRSVIPANVGLFISLLKDTTLVFIAGGGLLELLGIGRSVLAQPEWFGAHLEVYVFISLVFFVLCYTMSQASYRLEAQMGVGGR